VVGRIRFALERWDLQRHSSHVAQLFSLGILAPPFMNSKQLANVLIKILGLSVIVHNLSTLIGGLLTIMQASRAGMAGGGSFFLLTSVLTVFVGIFLIVKSRAIAEFLLKAEDE